ncbi:MAG: endolytic transglycosylase MltG [Peptostreptococcaceae bacterium]|nr:endolytic transglycosylase MltG [Peptostreptococcaceae bacterium]
MNSKLKDFLYDISDLFFAVVVVVAVIYLFYTNINLFFVDLFDTNISTNISMQETNSSNPVSAEDISNTLQDQNKDITITIPDDAVSTDIINILYENNLIKSKEEVRTYIEKNDLDKKLASGTFTLNKSMSKEEIISKITIPSLPN